MCRREPDVPKIRTFPKARADPQNIAQNGIECHHGRIRVVGPADKANDHLASQNHRGRIERCTAILSGSFVISIALQPLWKIVNRLLCSAEFIRVIHSSSTLCRQVGSIQTIHGAGRRGNPEMLPVGHQSGPNWSVDSHGEPLCPILQIQQINVAASGRDRYAAAGQHGPRINAAFYLSSPKEVADARDGDYLTAIGTAYDQALVINRVIEIGLRMDKPEASTSVGIKAIQAISSVRAVPDRAGAT